MGHSRKTLTFRDKNYIHPPQTVINVHIAWYVPKQGYICLQTVTNVYLACCVQKLQQRQGGSGGREPPRMSPVGQVSLAKPPRTEQIFSNRD